MADEDVLGNIQQLAAEEHELYERHRPAGSPLTEDEHRRMEELQVRLDQCWDLLRQRRARRQYGEDPSRRELATSRPSRTISSSAAPGRHHGDVAGNNAWVAPVCGGASTPRGEHEPRT